MDFTYFKTLPKETRIDIALCALVKILTGQMTKHLAIMKRQDKDTYVFIATYGVLISEISKDPVSTIEALRTLIEE